MKKIIFIKNLENTKWTKKILNVCSSIFTHVYIVDPEFKIQLQSIIFAENNKNEDSPGIYNINIVYNNIKNYSLMLNMNGESNYDETYNTHVDYLNYPISKNFNLSHFMNNLKFRINVFFNRNNITEINKSVAVIDLDDTLIDKEGDIIIKHLHKYLTNIKSIFDIIILWSHGCQNHVNHIFENSMAPYRSYFDIIIAKQSSNKTYNKGIGKVLKTLNVNYGICNLSTTLLIDDQSTNFNKDYDYFVHVPKYSKVFNKRMWRFLEMIIADFSNKLF
ncbi:38K protein [Callinectes sapidus nudivirus]|nr:38K protein [Callinectes sapidus nudivirus]